MKILILEDEIPAYQKLLGFINQEIEGAQIIGWARSIAEAKLLLDGKDQPDLIFSDIELLDGVSFKVYEEVKVSSPIIFCTGFDQYVLKAFQTNGIAYLLKPYSLENFKDAYAKYETLFAKAEKKPLDENLIQELKTILAADKKSYKQRFTVKKKDGVKLINTNDIVCFAASGDFCLIHDNQGKKHAINYKMSDIEEKVDPSRFFRINRSEIINVDFLEKIEPHFKNRVSIRMAHMKESLITSGAKTPEFRKWLEG